MSAGPLEYAFRGDTFEVAIDVSAYAVDIDGHTFRLVLKDDEADTDADAAVNHAHVAPSDTESAAGRTVITVPAASMEIEPRNYHLGIQWTTTDGTPIVRTIYASGPRWGFPPLVILADYARTTP